MEQGGRTRALVEAARLVAAGAAHDVEAVLDALADQARAVLGADDATISLADGAGGFVRRRPSRLADPDSPLARPGPAVVDDLVREAVDSGRAVAASDLRTDPRVAPEVRARAGAASGLVAPVADADATLGVLVVRWATRHAPTEDDLAAVEALAAHAATALRVAALAEERERRGRLEGALMTARAVSHELNNKLALAVGRAELLRDAPTDGGLADALRDALDGAALAVWRLQRIARFEETDVGGGPMLDIDAATAPNVPEEGAGSRGDGAALRRV